MDFNGDWFWHSEITFTEHQVFSWGTAAVPSWLGLRGQHFHSISQRHRAWEQMAPSRHPGEHCNRPTGGARRPFYGWIYNWWRNRGSDRSNRARLVAGPPASHRDGSSPLHWDGLGIKSCKITLSEYFVQCKIPLPTAGKNQTINPDSAEQNPTPATILKPRVPLGTNKSVCKKIQTFSAKTHFFQIHTIIYMRPKQRRNNAARTSPATTNFLDFFTLESSCTNFISTQHTAGMIYEKPI